MAGYRILDTYTSYKIKERKWTQWLVDTAEKAGHRIRENITANTNRKNIGTLPASHTVSIKNLASLAKSIVSGEPPQPVPEIIRQLLQDVISQRKEASVFYKSRSEEGTTAARSNEGHIYYVKVLEDVLRTLREAKTEHISSASNRKITPGEETTSLTNVFDILTVEDVNAMEDASFRDTADDREDEYEQGDSNGKENVKNQKPRKNTKKSKKQTGKGKKTPKPNKVDVEKIPNPITDSDFFTPEYGYEISEDAEDEFLFILYCFFKDFNDIRMWLQERWCDYQDGLCSLVEVSVATNTAFDIFQKSERMLLKLEPDLDFGEIAGLLFMEGGLAHVDYGDLNRRSGSGEDIGEDLTEEWNWLCLDTYVSLDKWLNFAPPRKIPTGNWHAESPDSPDVPKYQAQTIEEKLRRDGGIVFEFLAECCFIKGLELRRAFCIPAEDELTRGAIKMLHTRKIPMWLVFAFKIYCDIRVILESEVVNGRDDLFAVGQRSKLRLEGYLEYIKSLGMKSDSFIENRIAEIDCWIIEDWAGDDRTELHVRHGETEDEVEPFFFFRRNPILCGLIGFSNSLMMNETGLIAANRRGAVIGATHIYNAIRHEVPSFPKWQDMEALVLIHGQKRIFGDQIPSSPASYLQCYDLSHEMGEIIASLSKKPYENYKVKNPETRTLLGEEGRGIMPASVVSWLFYSRYCFARKTPDNVVHTLPDVEKVLNSMAQSEMQLQMEGFQQPALSSIVLDESKRRAIADREQNSKSISSKLTKQFEKSRALTSIQLLDALWVRMSQESMILAFDYFSMHQRCIQLLRSINEEFREEIKKMMGFDIEENRGQLPIVPYCIFKIMKDEGSWKSKSQFTERLVKVMKTLVEEEGNAEILAVRSTVMGNS